MSATTAPIQSPYYLSLKAAAELTGFSVFTMRDLVASGKLPAYRLNNKPGSAIRVKAADVHALMTPVIPSEIADAR